MCGAIGLEFSKIPLEDLEKFFTPEEIEVFRKSGEVVFAFWAVQPALPVRDKDAIRLRDWGNRDPKIKLPKTGWAKLESLVSGKWKHLGPKVVRIPADRGCEKKTWFDLSHDIKGILVQEDGVERIYMITEAATEDYKQRMSHDRMPRLIERKAKS